MNGEAQIQDQEVEFDHGMEDSALSAHLDGGEQESASAPETPQQGEPSAPAEEAMPDQRADIESLRKELEEVKRDREHWQKVSGRQSQEVGELRKLRDALEKRRAELRQQKAQDMIFQDPEAFRANVLEEVRTEYQIEQLRKREEAMQFQTVANANREEVVRRVADFENPEFFKAVVAEAAANGEAPENLRAFVQNPYAFHPSVALFYAERVKAKQRTAELEAKLKELEARPADIMQKIEQKARQKPISASTGGSAKGGGATPEWSRKDLAMLSDTEIDELLKAGK